MSDEDYIRVWTGGHTPSGKGIYQQMIESSPPPQDSIEAMDAIRDAIFDTSTPSTAPVLANINGRIFVAWPDGRMTVDDEPATTEDRLEWRVFFEPLFDKPAQ
jgi:hypothetical protein